MSSTSPCILSIDLGTSGPKLALVDPDGAIMASTSRSVGMRRVPPDGAEQDPEEIWNAICSSIREIVRDAGLAPGSIAGIAIASQFSAIVPVDRELRPVANLISWMDRRGAPHASRLHRDHPEAIARWLDVHGIFPLPAGTDSLSHMLWIQNERPPIYARTYKFLEPMDFVAARLTGIPSANACSAFTMVLTDNRRLDRVSYDDELVRVSGIDPDKLPALVPVGECVGTIRAAVAQELDLAPDIRVFSGVNDTQAVAVGTGTFRLGRGGLNVGTTSQVLAHVPFKRTDAENDIVSMPSPVAGLYAVLAENGLGASVLEHFLRQIVFARDALADHSTGGVVERVDAAVRAAPPGSGGLLYLPWLAGSQAPAADPAVRGGFLNMSLDTTREHMLRAVLEGVAFSLKWLLPAVERFAEATFAELRFAGGGALSDEWSQILADVVDRPVLQLDDARHVINRATAFLAFQRLGLLDLDAFDTFCPVRRTYAPRVANLDIYARLFEQFVAAFERNRPIFGALNGS